MLLTLGCFPLFTSKVPLPVRIEKSYFAIFCDIRRGINTFVPMMSPNAISRANFKNLCEKFKFLVGDKFT